MDVSTEIPIHVPKKRGRKPKNFSKVFTTDNNVDLLSEDEQIILHLKLTDIHKDERSMNDIFIKNVNDIHSIKKVSSTKNEGKHNVDKQSKNSNYTIQKNTFINNINKITSHKINITDDTKCWWCKNIFDCISIQLPESVTNDTFTCIGHFCSFNCAKSYNNDINDCITEKRNNLLNLMYYYMFSEYSYIEPAPHWQVLKEYGGIFTIHEYRKSIILNDKMYILLKPPIISREIIIEESYKNNELLEKSKNKNIIYLSNNINDINNTSHVSTNNSIKNTINTDESISKLILSN